MNRVLLVVAAALVLAGSVSPSAFAAESAQGPLTVEAAVGNQTASDTFEVEALLRNVSRRPIAFMKETCAYATAWESDNAAIRVAHDAPCPSDTDNSRVLKPGETEPFYLRVSVGKAEQVNGGTFKLIYHARVFQNGLPPWTSEIEKTDIVSAPLSLPVGAGAATTLLPR